MSTRGCVAIEDEDGWVGVYNHYDSYPDGLGKELYDRLSGKTTNELKEFANELLEYGDWRGFVNKGMCKYCGKKKGQPHTISGVIMGLGMGDTTTEISGEKSEKRKEALENVKKCGYPDPEAIWHEHTDSSNEITSEKPDPLFIEWVYVVVPSEQRIKVLCHHRVRDDGDTPPDEGPVETEEGWDYGNCVYTHKHVGNIHLDEPEPNWEDFKKYR